MKRKLWLVLLVCCLLLPTHTLAAYQSVDSIPIGALIPFSGELASPSDVVLTAIEKAVENANENLTAVGYDYVLELLVADSESDPETILARAEELRLRGTNIFIVGSSAEVEALREWSEMHGTIVISFSSSAPSLAIAGDGIFRVAPNDVHQAQALSTLMLWENISDIVIVHRNDIYGNELAELVIQEFTKNEGTASEPVVYEPNTTDFRDVVSQIEERLIALEADRSAAGIILIGFDEVVHLFAQADSLRDVRWFTSESLTKYDVLLLDEQTSSFAEAVQLTGVTFGIEESNYYEKVEAELQLLIGDKELIPKAVFAYDIPLMLISIMQRMDEPLDVSKLKEDIIELSGLYAGATGWMLLDEAGDRKYSQYDIWQVQRDDTTARWNKTAVYYREPGLPGYIIDWKNIDEDDPIDLEEEQEISRAEYVYLLGQTFEWSGAGDVLPFIDVNHVDSDLKRVLAQAVQRGIVLGYGDDTFRPDEPITRVEMIVMLVRAMQIPEIELSDRTFDDEEFIPSWAREHVTKAVAIGINILTENNMVNPYERITANEAISIMSNALQLR